MMLCSEVGVGSIFSLDLCTLYILSKLGNPSQVCYTHHSFCIMPQESVKMMLWTLNIVHVKQMRNGGKEVEGENKEHMVQDRSH